MRLILYLAIFELSLGLAYIAFFAFAKITYKIAHPKKNKKIYVHFEIDSKGKTLQEIQNEREQMKKILRNI